MGCRNNSAREDPAFAIVGRTNIHLSDVQQFCNSFGLPANDPQIILNDADPGILNSDEEGEADLDEEWWQWQKMPPSNSSSLLRPMRVTARIFPHSTLSTTMSHQFSA
jgi:hypothetical protein